MEISITEYEPSIVMSKKEIMKIVEQILEGKIKIKSTGDCFNDGNLVDVNLMLEENKDYGIEMNIRFDIPDEYPDTIYAMFKFRKAMVKHNENQNTTTKDI